MQFRSNRTRCPSRRNHGTPGGARLNRWDEGCRDTAIIPQSRQATPASLLARIRVH
jgi:hypothetical protein